MALFTAFDLGIWWLNEQQVVEMTSITAQFEGLIDRILDIFVPGMTFSEFIDGGGWLLIIGGWSFVFLVLWLMIVPPKNHEYRNKAVKRNEKT